MKNLAVGKKILVGFLIVILMIGVILGTTIITSLTRNDDLQRVNNMSDLQRTTNTLLNNFNLARVEIRTLFTSVAAEAEYYLAVDYLETCSTLLDEMEGMSTALGGYQTEELAQLRQMFAQVRTNIDAVGDNDEQVLAALANMQQSGLQMLESSQNLYELVSTLTMGIAAEDPTAGIERVNSVMQPAKKLNDTVANVQLLSRSLTLTQDLSVSEELSANLDSVVQQAATIRGILTTDEARAAIDVMTGSVDSFSAAVGDVENIVAKSDSEIAVARDTFLQLNDLVNGYVDTIAADVNSLNEGTIQTSNLTMAILIGISVIAVIFSFLVATILGRMITRPLNKMRDIAVQAGETGNLNFSEEVRNDILKEAESKDELGQSLKSFSLFVNRTVYIARSLEQVASKDLTVEVELLSSEDTMGNALRSMVDNLNDMFGEINSISSQVATAANEIAMGAQSLAQGSTEQASTIQQVSASINEINDQMNTSTQTAQGSARQAEEINQVALEGNEKMTHLTGSMQQINEASQNIGNVIKVIDDIAFQTNILALNAAVEAARAGEHGKGFAVVADEVRNLAGKSADAAKETAELISANIEKTEQGMTYTTETAESLAKIMEGITNTNESLQQVAEQAESAKAATGQVNLAIDQVAQVVQQNSATSEESAAASEEMSSQAQVLQQLISQFKLRGSSGGVKGLAASGTGEYDGGEAPGAAGPPNEPIIF